MTAGTVVITGGILAAFILLCIIIILCYCRLQYYCCKKNGADPDTLCPEPHFSCQPCSSPWVNGAVCTPLSVSTQSICPSCSPYASSFFIHSLEQTRNGGERVTYLAPLSLSPTHSEPLWNTRAISTDV
ncbi:hypothetical protein DNTS_001524 [Danionella cerebrum]|uniref:Uncharacterized protein n=1 Tax=Danionella cerebrum TaxID=2873325 RepID=A0A553PYW7_9TELE|nr:hypothetical protein DNTS_001524 [Danionella translucida]TRY82881.1 hypothetical protein DNTS_001524 [Danionella translucida]